MNTSTCLRYANISYDSIASWIIDHDPSNRKARSGFEGRDYPIDGMGIIALEATLTPGREPYYTCPQGQRENLTGLYKLFGASIVFALAVTYELAARRASTTGASVPAYIGSNCLIPTTTLKFELLKSFCDFLPMLTSAILEFLLKTAWRAFCHASLAGRTELFWKVNLACILLCEQLIGSLPTCLVLWLHRGDFSKRVEPPLPHTTPFFTSHVNT